MEIVFSSKINIYIRTSLKMLFRLGKLKYYGVSSSTENFRVLEDLRSSLPSDVFTVGWQADIGHF